MSKVSVQHPQCPHISAVEQAGLSDLREGQKVEYEVVPGRNGKSSAENLVVSD